MEKDDNDDGSLSLSPTEPNYFVAEVDGVVDACIMFCIWPIILRPWSIYIINKCELFLFDEIKMYDAKSTWQMH